MNKMHKRKILLGITGSIAAYKALLLIRELQQLDFDVRVILTASANAFVTPLTIQTLTNNKVYEHLLDQDAEAEISHIKLARWADFILIAPASANFIAKLSHGFADDLLSTICLAATVPCYIAPAMNQQMWIHPITQKNINTLEKLGYSIFGPDEGLQACGEVGPGRMLEPHLIAAFFANSSHQLLSGKNVLVTAGPTIEPIDSVRYISNRSSGKMGYAIASEALAAGANVTLISGPVIVPPPKNVHLIQVNTAKEMLLAVEQEIKRQDIFISTAAVSDYYIKEPSQSKIKKCSNNLTITLEPTVDILATIAKDNPNIFSVGFAAETNDVINYANTKRINKNVDMIIANDVGRQDIGFDADHNEVTVISESAVHHLERATKKIIANQIIKILCHEFNLKIRAT